MNTRNYRLKTVLFIVLAILFISSPIFAQEKTTTKKAPMDLNKKKEMSNTKVEEKSAKQELTNKQLLKKTEEVEAETPQEVETPTPPYSVGDFIHGGIVIYVDRSGEHGLVCAKTNQGSSVWWSERILNGIGANRDGIYEGIANTGVAVESEGNQNNAAHICYNLEITDGVTIYSDWYLPSKFELDLMIQNKDAINTTATAIGGDVIWDGLYWSSTEYSAEGGAWAQYGQDGSQEMGYKETKMNVRAIRKF